MSEAADRVLNRLRDLQFEVHEGSVTPFGEELPLVVGVGLDEGTAQLALVAEDAAGDSDPDAWQQLLFGIAGLRHQLGDGAPAALGTPVLLAVVDPEGERMLRGLVEELASRYALFSRVDLNLVPASDTADLDALDTALSPLLPRCRECLDHATITLEDLDRFWEALESTVREAARGLDAGFGDARKEAAEEAIRELVQRSEGVGSRSAPDPIRDVELENFRSFAHASFNLGSANVLYGSNGSGKSAVVEALELLWAGTTQRRPPGVRAAEYSRHLPRRGEGAFAVNGYIRETGAHVERSDVSEEPEADLARSVLTQDALADLVNRAPGERLAALLAVTGLQVPELEPRTRGLLDAGKQQVDAAFRGARISSLRTANTNGLSHLRQALQADFGRRTPSTERLSAAEQALAEMTGGAYEARDWRPHGTITTELLGRVDAGAEALSAGFEGGGNQAALMKEALGAVGEWGASARRHAEALRRLRAAMDVQRSPEQKGAAEPSKKGEQEPPLAPALAARWAAHARGLREAAQDFRSAAEGVADLVWRERIAAYADGLEETATRAHLADLERLTHARPSVPVMRSPGPADPELFREAGFSRDVDASPDLVAALSELVDVAESHAQELGRLAADLKSHPSGHFEEHRTAILGALSRYELARRLRRPGSPIEQASEEMLRELLKGRLYPILRELVAAIVRFEWYFEPIRMSVEGRQVLIGGLATPRSDLDARLLLNAAERAVVGVGWFLALHLLQPRADRRVLVLDDPAGQLDLVNQAGLLSTIRAYCRLVRPEQVVVATHDESFAALLEEELAPVAGWPSDVQKLRCSRNRDDASVVTEEAAAPREPDILHEKSVLGLSAAREDTLL